MRHMAVDSFKLVVFYNNLTVFIISKLSVRGTTVLFMNLSGVRLDFWLYCDQLLLMDSNSGSRAFLVYEKRTLGIKDVQEDSPAVYSSDHMFSQTPKHPKNKLNAFEGKT